MSAPNPALRPADVLTSLRGRPLFRSYDVRAVGSTGSTNVDLRGVTSPPGVAAVLTTEEQTAGRGRSGRTWSCPAGAGLMFSIRLVPTVPLREFGWTGAVLGLAVRAALADRVAVDLKWPNDLQIDGDKLGGILAEATGDGGVIVGVGLNVSVDRADLPRDDATSLAAVGVVVERAALLARVLAELDDRLHRWETDGLLGSGVLDEYRSACVTLGRQVRVELPGGRVVTGMAVEVDVDGAVVIQDAGGSRRPFAAGDVHHLRPAP